LDQRCYAAAEGASALLHNYAVLVFWIWSVGKEGTKLVSLSFNPRSFKVNLGGGNVQCKNYALGMQIANGIYLCILSVDCCSNSLLSCKERIDQNKHYILDCNEASELQLRTNR
jgi:hypothetical protein